MESEKGTNVVSLLSIKGKLLTTAMFIKQVTKHSVSYEFLEMTERIYTEENQKDHRGYVSPSKYVINRFEELQRKGQREFGILMSLVSFHTISNSHF